MTNTRKQRCRTSHDSRQLEFVFAPPASDAANLLQLCDRSLSDQRRRWAVRAGVRSSLAGVIAILALSDEEAR